MESETILKKHMALSKKEYYQLRNMSKESKMLAFNLKCNRPKGNHSMTITLDVWIEDKETFEKIGIESAGQTWDEFMRTVMAGIIAGKIEIAKVV